MASFAQQPSPMLFRQLSDSSQTIARNSTNNLRTATALLIQISQAHRDGSIDTFIKNFLKNFQNTQNLLFLSTCKVLGKENS